MNKKFSKVILFMIFMMVTSAIYAQGDPPPRPGIVPPNPVPIPGIIAMVIAGAAYGFVKLRKNE